MNEQTELNPDDISLLEHVAGYYQGNLSQEAKDYLQTKSLGNFEVINRLGVGFADGSLLDAISAEQKSSLKKLHLLSTKGKEVLLGSLVIPLKNQEGKIVGLAGHSLSSGKERLVSLAHGFANQEALSVYAEEIILVDGVLDFLVLLNLGQNNVITSGGQPLVPACSRLLQDHRIKRVVLLTPSTNDLKTSLLDVGITVRIPTTHIAFATKEDVDSLLAGCATFEPQVKANIAIQKTQDRWVLTHDALTFRAIGVKDNFTTNLKVSIRVDAGTKKYHDTVDLLSSRSRRSFSESCAAAIETEFALIEHDLLRLLDAIEADQEERMKDQPGAPVESPLTDEEVKLGMEFLKNPDLFGELVRDLDALGYVGEETNKKIAYLVATSRILNDPLNLLVVSSASAGKSFLIESVRKLIPTQDVLNLTSLSEQSLNYMGETSLLHKLLILGEAVHSDSVEHSIREMISAKELSRMVVAKNDRTGKMESKIERTKAVVSLMMSTTAYRVNPENLTRYLVIHADEGEEQTRRIHQQQNRKFSLEHLHDRSSVIPAIVQKHHAAQRLLKPVHIVNPFWDALEFPSLRVRSRRDNQQLNNLIIAVAFLRQHQKERKTVGGMEYIEATQQDYTEAKALFHQGILRQTYIEFPESLLRLFEEVRSLCQEKAKELSLIPTEVSFDVNELRRRVSFLGIESIQKYLKKLLDLEYLGTLGTKLRGQKTMYRLIEDKSFEELEGIGVRQGVPS